MKIFLLILLFIFMCKSGLSEEYYERRSCRAPLPTLSIYICRISISGRPAKKGGVLKVINGETLDLITNITLRYDGITELFGVSNVNEGTELIFYYNNLRLKPLNGKPIVYKPDMLTHDISLYYEKPDTSPPVIVRYYKKGKNGIVLLFNEVIELPKGFKAEDIIISNKEVLDVRPLPTKNGMKIILDSNDGRVLIDFKQYISDLFGNVLILDKSLEIE